MHTVTHVADGIAPCRWEVSQEAIVACNRASGRRIRAVLALTGLNVRPVSVSAARALFRKRPEPRVSTA